MKHCVTNYALCHIRRAFRIQKRVEILMQFGLNAEEEIDRCLHSMDGHIAMADYWNNK